MRCCAVMLWVTFLVGVAAAAEDDAPINGVPGLGALRVDQVTFPGTHNSGAGYRGHLAFWSGLEAPSGFYRNQTKSFTEQLELGVRYLDIDTMWVPKKHAGWWAGGAWTGHKNAYGGPLTDLVGQLRAFLDRPEHVREVVIVEFNYETYEAEQHTAAIAADLAEIFAPLVEKSENRSGVRLGRRDASGAWPRLDAAVRDNRRLFVLMHRQLYDRLPPESPARAAFVRTDYDNPPRGDAVTVRNAYVYRVVTSADDCRQSFLGHADQCDSPAAFVRLSCFAPFGLEMSEMARKSAPFLRHAALAADRLRAKHQRPVNFLLVDRVGDGGEGEGENNLFALARRLNEANLQRFAAGK